MRKLGSRSFKVAHWSSPPHISLPPSFPSFLRHFCTQLQPGFSSPSPDCVTRDLHPEWLSLLGPKSPHSSGYGSPFSKKLSQPPVLRPPLNPRLLHHPLLTDHVQGSPGREAVSCLPAAPNPHPLRQKSSLRAGTVSFSSLYLLQYLIGLRDGKCLILSISRRSIFFRPKHGAYFPASVPLLPPGEA